MKITNAVCSLIVLVALTACGPKSGVTNDTQTATTASTDLALGIIPLSQIKQIAYRHSGGFPPPSSSQVPKIWSAVSFKSDGSAVASKTSVLNGIQTIDSQPLNSNDLHSLISTLELANLSAPGPLNEIDAGNTYLEITLNDSSVQTYQFSGGDSTGAISVIIGTQLQQILEGYLNQTAWENETEQPLSI